MDPQIDLIKSAYRAFNAREIEAALAPLDDRVAWADGKGGVLHGRSAVREHWLEQWAEADPEIDIQAIARTPQGIVASIRVRMQQGDERTEQRLTNVFRVDGERILAMRVP
jgi:hypothetical protein